MNEHAYIWSENKIVYVFFDYYDDSLNCLCSQGVDEEDRVSVSKFSRITN